MICSNGAIFEQLGYAPVFRYEKFRTEWSQATSTIEGPLFTDAVHLAEVSTASGHLVLDETPIGNYAELEGPPAWIDDTLAKLGGNKRLDEYSRALKELCAQEKIPYADQFHAVIDIWGKNKPDENLVNALPTLKSLAKNDNTDGVEHLRAFLAAQEKSTRKLVSMQGDPVHPGVPGQLMMAAALLKELGAEPFVSSVIIDAANLTVRSKGCTVHIGKQPEKGGLFFDRLDECLPFPIPDEARNVLPLYPTILEMSQYTLKVTGLKGGKFQLWINSSPVAVLTGKELEAGVNLTEFGSGKVANPIAAQGKHGGTDNRGNQSRNSLPVRCRNTDSRFGRRKDRSTNSSPAAVAPSASRTWPARSAANAARRRWGPLPSAGRESHETP